MPKWSREETEAYYYVLYQVLLQEARCSFKHIGNTLKINNKSAAKLYRWALKEEILLPPFLRLKSFPNYHEYTYFVKFKDTTSVYEKLKDDPRVLYQCVCAGVFDLMIITNERIDVSMEEGFEYIVLSGPRGDYMYNNVEKKSMIQFIEGVHHFLREGNFVVSEIGTLKREKLLWDDMDWALFKLLKDDVRMKYIDIIRCLGLYKSTFYNHLNKVMEKCTVWTPFYPHGYAQYNPYYILFKTNYEDQLVKKLKEIPVHCPIFTVKSWICACIFLERDFLQIEFFNLLRSMQSSGFIEEYRYSVPLFHWKREWTTQDFQGHSPRRKV